MAKTFPFRGPIPDWLDAQTTGHPYWQPSEVPLPTFGRRLLDGASAVFAFASVDLRHQFEDATAALQALGMCPDPDKSVVFELIAYNYREDKTFNIHNTPEYKAWRRWNTVLQIILANGVGTRLRDGVLVAFGDPGSPGVPPFWIEPQTWGALKNVPGAPGHFAGGGVSFWSVRVVDPSTVIAPTTELTGVILSSAFSDQRNPDSSIEALDLGSTRYVSACEWMQREARSERQAGGLIKGETAQLACRAATNCTAREAKRAFAQLPSSLRRTRGGKDR